MSCGKRIRDFQFQCLGRARHKRAHHRQSDNRTYHPQRFFHFCSLTYSPYPDDFFQMRATDLQARSRQFLRDCPKGHARIERHFALPVRLSASENVDRFASEAEKAVGDGLTEITEIDRQPIRDAPTSRARATGRAAAVLNSSNTIVYHKYMHMN
jgi:hypothetical protein